MFGFMKNKVYRRLFVNLSIVIFIILASLSFLAYNEILKNEFEYIKHNNKRVSEYIEAAIRTKQSILDDKLNAIYNNDKSYSDFINFFKLDIDEYLAKRLDAYKPFEYYPTISKTSQSLIYSDSDISTIIIHNYIKNRTMVYSTTPVVHLKTYDSNGSNGSFNTEEFLKNSGGFVIRRDAFDPNTFEKICSIYIIYDTAKLFPLIDRYDSGDVIIASDNGSYIALNQPLKSRFVEENISIFLQQDKVEGEIPTGYFSNLHYTNYPVAGQAYEIITIVDRSIINVNELTILAVFALAFILFIISELFVANKLKDNAFALNNIINTIDNAKSGRFMYTKVANRKDEYGLIARELNDMVMKLDKYIKLEYKLKLEQKQMQFELLQSRLNPHFLYNTLETIRARALLNHDKEVSDAVSHLGGLYRDLLKFDSEITLRDELKLTQRYLDLMSFIYDKRFFYTIDVDDDIAEVKTIKLWIQLLVENFFVHGIDKNSDTNVLVIRGFRSSDDRVVIQICDNGLGIDKNEIEKINERIKNDDKGKSGLNNVYRRLKIFYGDNGVDMRVENNPIAGVTVNIEIKEVRYVQDSNS
ncbi:MAG TPA: histidine kinase [Clostridiales bacterium]|nr:histidine kinase [Clostridiales bacterium]